MGPLLAMIGAAPEDPMPVAETDRHDYAKVALAVAALTPHVPVPVGALMADPILVVIFLRGGADSLSLVAPTADADYLAARPEYLRVARTGDAPGHVLTDALADVDFRLHPAAGELAELFHAGDLSILHATGRARRRAATLTPRLRIERAASDAAAGGWLGRRCARWGRGDRCRRWRWARPRRNRCAGRGVGGGAPTCRS